MGKTLTNEEFLNKLEDKHIKYIPLEEYKGQHVKIKWRCFDNDKHIFEATPRNVIDGKAGCPYCFHTKVLVGETDMWTTNPELAKMLKILMTDIGILLLEVKGLIGFVHVAASTSRIKLLIT